MTETLHIGLREGESYFDTRTAYADALDMPRTTLIGWLDAEPGSKEYVPEPELDEKRLSRLVNAVFAEGQTAGYEAGQQDTPDLPENEERVHDGEVYKTAKNVADPVETPEEAAEHFGIDTDRYYADKIECGKHTVPVKPSEAKTMMVGGTERLVREETIVEVECYRLSVTWRPHQKRQMAASFVEGLMSEAGPPAPSGAPEPPTEGLVRTISIPDLHLGNLIWDPEGEMAWNLQIGKKQWQRAFRYLLRGAREEGVTDLAFDVGNDAAHSNGTRGESANGTKYSQVAPAYHTAEAMAEMYQWAIEEARKMGLRVHAVVVGGNHDWDPAQWMGRALEMRYEDWEHVHVYRSPEPWQFLRFGATLLGFAHGKNPEGHQLKAKDFYALAAEQPGWFQADYTEIRTGHTHTRELDTLGGYVEHKGVLIRTSPSLCPPDAFHKRNHYHQALRAAEMYDYDPDHGLVQHRPFLPDLMTDEAAS